MRRNKKMQEFEIDPFPSEEAEISLSGDKKSTKVFVSGQCTPGYKHDLLHCKKCKVTPEPCTLHRCPCERRGFLFKTNKDGVYCHQMPEHSKSIKINTASLTAVRRKVEESLEKTAKIQPRVHIVGQCLLSKSQSNHDFLHCSICKVKFTACNLPDCPCDGVAKIIKTSKEKTFIHQMPFSNFSRIITKRKI